MKKTIKIGDITYYGRIGVEKVNIGGIPHLIVYNNSNRRGSISFHKNEDFVRSSTYEPGVSIIEDDPDCTYEVSLIEKGTIGAKPKLYHTSTELEFIELDLK